MRIGVRDLSGHSGTGRAAIVLLQTASGAAGRCSITSRTDVALVPDGLPARVYHEAPTLPPAEASALVADVERVAARTALDVLAGLLSAAEDDDVMLSLPIDAAEKHNLPTVSEIVASHTLMHVAETALYREAFLSAAEGHGIEVHRYEPGTVRETLSRLARVRPAEVDQQLAEWGRIVGSPWRREHKEAALGAWLAAVVPPAR